ncbi:MAG: hypothetical protein H6858_05070 [Rhodospirillales bacterium]|nr:hypothetical protein [Alphaproteobacteria bacterium]MCB1839804.1 hypothetical protein [Alphaproteobacteria bacterium]MCB9976952.1 hypothetical protein [Rhodospirillales bacterium]
MAWKGVSTECKPCQPLVEQYNLVMDDLLFYRYMLKQSEWVEEQYDKSVKDQLKSAKKAGPDDPKAAKTLGTILEVSDGFKKYRHNTEGVIKELENAAQRFRQLVAECEKQCTGQKVKTTGIKAGGLPAIKGVDTKNLPPLPEHKLPYDWKGFYEPVCKKCQRLAERLNILPLWTTMAQAELISYETEYSHYKELYRLSYLAGDLGTLPYDWSTIGKAMNVLEHKMYDLEAEIDAYTENFKRTLKVYNKCIKTCPEKPKKTACVVPKAPHSITVGANSEVGSGAALKDKISGQAKGMAMGALNNVIGGSGFSLGGGGNKSKGPKTQKDPTKGQYIASESNGVKLGVRTGINKDRQVLISAKIIEGPGDGTFQAMWLEDGAGDIILPTEYLIFSLYRDWKLTVWWTEDHYVNGQHVSHDEGKEVTVGRDHYGDFALRYQGPEGMQNSIWNQLGFNNASKGVQSLGVVFPVTVDDLASNPCPYYLQTQITLPKLDPVRTVPFLHEIPVLGEAFRNPDDKKAKKDLQIMIRPAIIGGAEE